MNWAPVEPKSRGRPRLVEKPKYLSAFRRRAETKSFCPCQKIREQSSRIFSFVSAQADTTSLGEAHIICGVSHNIIVRRADTNERDPPIINKAGKQKSRFLSVIFLVLLTLLPFYDIL